MKRAFKRIVSLFLAVVMVLGVAPLSGFVGLELPNFNFINIKANASSEYTSGIYTYKVDESGNATIVDCDEYIANGNITVPTTLGSYPVIGIGDRAYYGCQKITSVIFSDNITNIGNDVFGGCTKLESFIVSNDNKLFSSDDFGVLFNKDKSVLIQYPSASTNTDYIIPNSVKHINDYAFYECENIKEIIIPNGVTTIGASSFSGCSNLSNIIIPDSTINIGKHAFLNCYMLSDITVCSSNPSYSNDECGVLFNKDKTLLICYPRGNTHIEYIIPETVVSIEDYAFSFSKISYILIGDNVKNIGEGAFWACKNLSNIIISDEILKIEKDAFGLCSLITEDNSNYRNGAFYVGNHLINAPLITGEYIIESGTKVIADYAFYNYRDLTRIDIPDSVTSIGKCAFGLCENIAEITIPNNVSIIGESAFLGCSKLSNLEIGNSVVSIGNKAFSGCENLVNLTIGEKVNCIGDSAFYSCKKLKSVVIPNNVTKIGEMAFYLCSRLENLLIGNGVICVGDYAFGECISLTTVTIPNTLSCLGKGMFSFCSNLTKVNLSDGLLNISDYAFIGCENLTSVIIPKSVVSIDEHAFDRCGSISSIVIGRNISNIDNYAFFLCENLKDIYYTEAEDQWNKITIGTNNECLANATIHFNSSGPSSNDPTDTEKYKNATGKPML